MDISDKAKTILVVDDESHITTFMESLLVKEGYKVAVANNGRNAIDIVETSLEGIDLVLSDIAMPGMNGMEVCAKLREFKPELLILLMSGYPKEHFENIGNLPFMQKPIHPSELFRAIRDIFENQSHPRHNSQVELQSIVATGIVP